MSATSTLWQELSVATKADSFLPVATGIFFLAVVHAFLAPWLARLLHQREESSVPAKEQGGFSRLKKAILHCLVEVECVFGLWAIVLIGVMIFWPNKGWAFAQCYLSTGNKFFEPFFVFVIMVMASARAIMEMTSGIIKRLSAVFGGSVAVSWFVTLTFTPLLGSLITEPAAMTIGALLLAQQFYHLQPSVGLKYATLALLFVNVSIGGALTHFAAPPLVMVAQRWGWTTADVFQQFGLASLAAILISNTLAYFFFRKEFSALSLAVQSQKIESKLTVPFWVLGLHLAFMAWTVYMLVQHQARWMGLGLSAYVAFHAVTHRWQNPISFRSPLLVGFFLAGLVVLGGQQSWWISPVLVRMDETSLLFASVVLTSFNDNAAITYLASQVPALAESGEISAGLRHAVMAGALAGGGLTVIANAPNPAGQAILGRHFAGGISPWRLFLWAIIPTLVALLAYSIAR